MLQEGGLCEGPVSCCTDDTVRANQINSISKGKVCGPLFCHTSLRNSTSIQKARSSAINKLIPISTAQALKAQGDPGQSCREIARPANKVETVLKAEAVV